MATVKRWLTAFVAVCAFSAVVCGGWCEQLAVPETSYPTNWTNNLELMREAAGFVMRTTNLFGMCWQRAEVTRLRAAGDHAAADAVAEQWRADRDALVMYWVEAFRTNGFPVWTDGVAEWTNGIPVFGE